MDEVKNLTPKQRLKPAREPANPAGWRVAPIRQTYIPKPGTTEKRGPGIPVMADRACQALVKPALKPEWEAQFEPNSYGFRPGRSVHDAIEAIFNAICLKPKYMLEADIEKCFDRINHEALLKKLKTIPPVERLIRGRHKGGIVDKGQWLFPEAGTPQGGVISPLPANVALHGFERAMDAVSRRYRIGVIRYADDFDTGPRPGHAAGGENRGRGLVDGDGTTPESGQDLHHSYAGLSLVPRPSWTCEPFASMKTGTPTNISTVDSNTNASMAFTP